MILLVCSCNCVLTIGTIDDKRYLLLVFITFNQGEDAFTRSLVYGGTIKV